MLVKYMTCLVLLLNPTYLFYKLYRILFILYIIILVKKIVDTHSFWHPKNIEKIIYKLQKLLKTKKYRLLRGISMIVNP